MKPFKTLSLLLSVNLALAALWFFFPEDGIPLTKNFTLKFANVSEMKETAPQPKVELENVLQASYIVESSDELYVEHEATERGKVTVPFEHPDAFNNPLFGFFERLEHAEGEGKPIRVLHFGDSQIEADRITGEFRNLMQGQFGGCGVGLVPITESSHARISINRKTSENWSREEVYASSNGLEGDDWGVMGYVHQFSGDAEAATTDSAWAELQASSRYFERAGHFDRLGLLYSGHGGQLNVFQNGNNSAQSLGEGLQYSQFPIQSDDPVRFQFSSAQSPELFGVTLDCSTGVAVDNISWRGSSGIEFTKMDRDLLKAQFDSLNVGMVIFEFGVNVVPYVREEYSWYENRTSAQLKLLRELLPEVPILVVGVSDMARNEGGEYVSYPNVGKIGEAQRTAALENGCSFWDLREAMGGEQSMVAWVDAKPSLAQKDYTHFNARGAKVVGNMLFDALMEDYQLYRQLHTL